jgi:general secretion pathway protein H
VKRQLERRGKRRNAGFTLIELLVVVVIIVIASSVATLALRDPSATQLEQEAARLAALLEGARAEARSSGLVAAWAPNAADAETAGFKFVGLPASAELPTRWLADGVSAEVVGARAVVLGPEPLIGAQRVVLKLNEKRLTLGTDGLGPFVVVDDEAPAGR